MSLPGEMFYVLMTVLCLATLFLLAYWIGRTSQPKKAREPKKVVPKEPPTWNFTSKLIEETWDNIAKQEDELLLKFHLNSEAHSSYAEVKRLSGLESNAEVFRRATSLYGWALKQKEQGNTLMLMKEDGETKVVEFE